MLSRQFSPQQSQPIQALEWLSQAKLLDPHALIGLSPLYIMNVVNLSPIYRSLILDAHGDTWVTTRSTEWVVKQWSHYWGCRYDHFVSFFHQRELFLGQSVPFVWGNLALIKVNTRGNRTSDWLNISLCQTFEWVQWKRHTHYDFVYDINGTRLTIRLDWLCESVRQQLKVAMALNRAWFVFHATGLSKQQFAFAFQPHALFERRFACLNEVIPAIEPSLIQDLWLWSLCHQKEG